LAVDPHSLHRRRVWEAFGSGKDRRCGRWSALLALGVTIRAWPADTLKTEFAAYQQPAPLRQTTRSTGVRGVWEDVVVDPEDSGYQEPEPEPVAPRRRAVLLPPR
jgi:hypothetical protein